MKVNLVTWKGRNYDNLLQRYVLYEKNNSSGMKAATEECF